jgi:DNA-binding response OmpR family regulator
MVLDDDADHAHAIADSIAARGFVAIAATSWADGRSTLGSVNVDALVGHLALRDGSLFDLIRMLRAQRRAIVVGYADVEIRLPPDLDAYFVRPIDLGRLGALLAAHFGLHASSEHARVVPPKRVSTRPPPRALVEGTVAHPKPRRR